MREVVSSCKAAKAMPHQSMENFLTGILHNRLGRTLLRYVGFGFTEPISSLKPL